MNIISGKYKNLRIESPQSDKTHPMGSREKLAIFNMLAPSLLQANVLDIFAGSGALGLEALSRGAAHVTFVEKSSAVARVIKKNAALLKIPHEQYDVITADAKDFTAADEFDVILADPPYDHYDPDLILPLEASLKPGGLLLLSHPDDTDPLFTDLEVLTKRTYAGAHITIFEKNL